MESFEKQFNQPKPPEETKNPELKQETTPVSELAQKPPENLNESDENTKENQEKNLKLEGIRQEVENIGDRLGKPIDEGIKESVVMFKANDLPTSDFCEGHIERGLPVPYVEVSAPNEPEERFVGQNEAFWRVAKKYNITPEEAKTSKIDEAYWEAMKECSQNEETAEYQKWNKENEKLLAKGHNLLKEFYKERQVEPDLKLEIEEDVGNFRIHNGGKNYQPVIEEEQKFTEEEKKIRAEKIEKYRAEMDEFTKFLQNKFMGDFSFEEYRKNLAEQLGDAPKEKRREILDEAQKTAEYQKARTLKIESIKRQEKELELLQSTREKIGLRPESEKLSEISRENLERLRIGFAKAAVERGMFASESEVLEAIRQEKGAVEGNMTLTVNLSPESIARFFEKGKQETLWDHLKEAGSLENMKKAPTVQGKDLHSEYISYRETAENNLKQYVPEEFQDKKPIYAALAGGTSRDLERGACPKYGNLFFELDITQLGKSSLNFNDSFANVEKKEDGTYYFDKSSLLAIEDAEEAKAIINLMKKHNRQFPTVGGMVSAEDAKKILRIDGKTSGYVEAAVFDDITPEKVKNIGVSLINKEDLKGIGNLIEKFPQFKDKFKFSVENEEVIGGLSASWLDKNFEGKVNFAKKMENADELWQEIGLKPEASFSDIRNALNSKCEELWKGIKLYVRADFHSKAQSGNIRMIRKNMWRLASKPEAKQKAELYSKLEEERLFFSG